MLVLDTGGDERLSGELLTDPPGESTEFSGTLELLAALERLRRHDVAPPANTQEPAHTHHQESTTP